MTVNLSFGRLESRVFRYESVGRQYTKEERLD